MDALATALLRRFGRLYLPEPGAAADRPADADKWVRVVEVDLMERGWVLSAAARARLSQLAPLVRTQWADWVLAAADQSVGAHRVHAPLFRSFPDTPSNPDALFVDRLLAHWFQDTDVRCVLCGSEGTVAPVDPCGHLVCTRCFDPQQYSACPICGRLAVGAGLLAPVATRPAGPPVRLTYIDAGDDVHADAIVARDELALRPGALGEQDRADLRAFVQATEPTDLAWLPDEVPSRETVALLCAWALQQAVLPSDRQRVLIQVSARWRTATDIARTLWAYSGGDPGLVLPARPQPGPDEGRRPPTEPAVEATRPKVRAFARPVRRAVLSQLDGFGAARAGEDMARHETVWKRLGERLHPFENVNAFPEASVAFAAIRSTRTQPDSSLGQALAAAVQRHEPLLQALSHPDGRVSVKVRTLAAVVEEALNAGEFLRALTTLKGRPGEFWRRVDHLSRLAGDDPGRRAAVLAAACDTAAAVSPAVLASAAAQLNGRHATVRAAPTEAAGARAEARAEEAAATRPATGIRRWLRARVQAATAAPPRRPGRPRPPAPAPGTPRRVFFPRGDVARSWTEPERRDPLHAELVAELRAAVDRELIRRAASLPRFDIAVIDAALLDVPAPTRARASSAQLAGWTRGSRLPLPDLEVLRLFLHWVQLPSARVDLDLSCAFYREDWSHAGHCDYTTLRFAKDGAVHSGDFTSAPEPFGATEFLDLDLARLAAADVRYAVPVVFSFNDVPFERLPEAFAGFSLPTARDAQFDAGRVVQRFDLRGDARMLVPMIIDVRAGELLWVDVQVTSRGYGHRAGRHSSNLARLGADLWDHFGARTRPTMFDVAAWHAVARADEVYVADLRSRAAVRVDGVAAGGEAAVGELRRAARAPLVDGMPPVDGRTVLAVAADAADVADALGTRCDPASVAAAPVGQARPPWFTIRPAELLAGLTPER